MPLTIYSIDDVLDTNEEGIEIIKRCEAFMPGWYKCPANVWTIGYGTTEGSLAGITRAAVRGPIDEETADKDVTSLPVRRREVPTFLEDPYRDYNFESV